MSETLEQREASGAADGISFEVAVSLLPEGDYVHTFLGFIGADWKREKVIDALLASPDIRPTGPMAQAMGHGLAIKHPDRDSVLFVATTRRTDEPA
ncbi:MAG: hypothetical protein ACR652_24605 [Methylocystis sp.]|uniref:hypothetical protein n=1 Tax=Methylocystis sp. TaxID=1911079 RepID=UPI003DA6990D